jgi:hypothetical protein
MITRSDKLFLSAHQCWNQPAIEDLFIYQDPLRSPHSLVQWVQDFERLLDPVLEKVPGSFCLTVQNCSLLVSGLDAERIRDWSARDPARGSRG